MFISAIANPKAPPGTKDAIKSFNYDYSYWSHDVSTKIVSICSNKCFFIIIIFIFSYVER